MTIINKFNTKPALVALTCIFLACFVLTLSSKFKMNGQLFSNAILFDLLITAPVTWLVIMGKSTLPKLTAIRIFIIGLLIAGWLLKSQPNRLLQILQTWISPMIEGLVIIYIARKFYTANKKARISGINNVDFLSHCRLLVGQVIGNEKAGNIIASEIGVLYYAFIGRKDKNADYQSKFTAYKSNGIILVLGTFLALFLIETIGGHFLLSLWNTTFAWVITALSFYTCLQLYAHIKAIKARLIHLGEHTLEIYNGLAGDAFIKYSNIEKVELSKKIPVGGKGIKIALIKGLENHNCVIYLKEPIEVTKIFDIKKSTDTILFFVDRPADFEIALNGKMINIPFE